MNQIGFLKEQINSIGLHSLQSVLYEYSDFTGTHFVQLIPSEIVDGNEFDHQLSKLIIDFETKFQGEMLCFLGSSSLTKLENPKELLCFGEITYILPKNFLPNFDTLFTSTFLEAYTLSYGNARISAPSLSGNSLLPINIIGEVPFNKKFDFSEIENISIAAEPEEAYSNTKGEISLSLAA